MAATCCWCVKARKGTLIAGWFSLVGAIINVVIIVMTIAREDPPRGNVTDMVYPTGELTAIRFLSSIGLLLVVFNFGISSSLLFGVYKRRPNFLLPFLFYGILQGVFYVGIALYFHVNEETTMAIFIAISGTIPPFFSWIVWKHYEELRLEGLALTNQIMSGPE